MKKSILLLLPFSMILAACSGGNLSKGSIFNEGFMKYNFTPEFSLSEVKAEALTKTAVSLGEYDAIDQDAQVEYLVHVTKGTEKGLFNLNTGSYFIPLGEHDEIVAEYVDIVNNEYGFDEEMVFVRVTDVDADANKTSTIYDESGHAIFTGKGDEMTVESSYIPRSQRKSNEIIRFVVNTDNDLEPKVLYYDYDGNIVSQGNASEFNPKSSDYYHEGRKMTDYGHKELELVYSETEYYDAMAQDLVTSYRVQVYNNEQHKYVASFAVPKRVPDYIAGDYFIYQEYAEVEERATDYDLYSMGEKLNITTYRINYTNGAREDIETKNLIFIHNVGAGAKNLFDDKGVKRYQYFEDVRVIKDDRTLDPNPHGYVLNDKVEMVADVTGINLAHLYKLSDGKYMDDLTDCIYDNSLSEIGYYEPIIQGEEYGWGLADINGKVIVAPNEEFVTALGYGYYQIVSKDSFKLVKFDYATGELTNIKEFAKETYEYNDTNYVFTMVSDAEKSYILDLTTGNMTEVIGPAVGDVERIVADGEHLASGHHDFSVRLYQAADSSLYTLRIGVQEVLKNNFAK